MTAEYMGGFATSAGPECICSWAVPIPVTSDTILSEIARLDRSIALAVNDINTRMVIGEACYGDVWQGVDLGVEFDPEKCQGCKQCRVMEACPMKAVRIDSQGASALRDESLCFHCGLCVQRMSKRCLSMPYGCHPAEDHFRKDQNHTGCLAPIG